MQHLRKQAARAEGAAEAHHTDQKGCREGGCRMKTRLPPSAIMTKAQKAAAEEYAGQLLQAGIDEIVPLLEDILVLAAIDSGLRERTTQRIINHYEKLFSEFADDLITDTDLAIVRIKKALEQREIETEEAK